MREMIGLGPKVSLFEFLLGFSFVITGIGIMAYIFVKYLELLLLMNEQGVL